MDGLKISHLQLLNKLKQRVVLENIELLLTKMSRLCFNKCVAKPEFSLDSTVS